MLHVLDNSHSCELLILLGVLLLRPVVAGDGCATAAATEQVEKGILAHKPETDRGGIRTADRILFRHFPMSLRECNFEAPPSLVLALLPTPTPGGKAQGLTPCSRGN